MPLANAKTTLDVILKSERPLILCRRQPDADGIAAALALQLFLARRGKKAEVVADGFTPPKSLGFLAGIAGVKSALPDERKFVITLDVSKAKVGELKYDLAGDKLRISINPKQGGGFDPKDVSSKTEDFAYDCIITLDAPTRESLGAPFEKQPGFFYDRPTVNIDHDLGNDRHGNAQAVDITASSTCEVLYGLLKSGGEHFLNEDIATCLLAGIIAKTRAFRTPNVTPATLEIASALVSAGGKRDQIVQSLYRTRSIATLKLWGRALARLKYDAELKMAWTVLVHADFVHAGVSDEHLADVIDELIANAPDAEIIGVLYEKDNTVCGLLASEKHPDAHGLVAGLKPEGSHRLARLCFTNVPIIEAEQQVLATVRKALRKPTPASAAAPASVR